MLAEIKPELDFRKLRVEMSLLIVARRKSGLRPVSIEVPPPRDDSIQGTWARVADSVHVLKRPNEALCELCSFRKLCIPHRDTVDGLHHDVSGGGSRVWLPRKPL